MTELPPPSGRNVLHETGLDLLRLQTRELDGLIDVLAPNDPVELDSPTRVVAMMLQAIGVSLHSVVKLTAVRDMAIRDCFGIARTVAETAVNASFIAVGGEPMADKAVRHMRQKRWRDLRRSAVVSGKEVFFHRDIGAQVGDFPGLQEALSEYTTKKGMEVRDWTSENIDERIALVEQYASRAGPLLSAAIFTIYRPSSELLHGTYYGVNYFWQGSQETPATTKRAFEELWTLEHFVTLLSTLMFASSGAIEAVAQVRGLPDFQRRQAKVIGLVSDWSEQAHASDPDDEHLCANEPGTPPSPS